MGLGYKPIAYVSGPGADIINANLMSFERIDASGIKSDSLRLTVSVANDSGTPKEGAELTWFEGYDGNVINKGTFKITRVVPQLFPPQITIVATAAPFVIDDKTEFKARRSRSWDGITFGDLFREVVLTHGFSPRVDPELESKSFEHVEQTDETDSAFLTRIARKHDAVAKPVDSLYVLARRGKVKTITGQDLPEVTVYRPYNNEPTNPGFSNALVDKPSKHRFNGVRAKWLNQDTGEEQEVKLGDSPFKRLSSTYSSEADAQLDVEAEMRKINRTGRVLRMDIPGDPLIVAEGIVVLGDSWPNDMAGRFSVDKVTARGGGNSVYRLSVDATVPLN
ncbi:TPA: phage late control D family protein [Vibrio parahaemolyticus]|nr:phage late control D family protein [Vibrio parahaemolyticus]